MKSNLTVIIPNYNNERYIKKCLDSVLAQTMLPEEIIVVDDCSSDSSVDILKEYLEKCSILKCIFLEKNGGVSHARNIGIKNSRTRFVTTLDADDFYYDIHKLENEMTLLMEHNGAVVTYSMIVKVNEEGDLIQEKQNKKSDYLQGRISCLLIADYKNKTVPRDYCYDKKVLDECGYYDENSNLFEDLDLLIRISRHLPVLCTHEYGTAYRIKKHGLSQRPKAQIISAKTRIFKNEFDKSTFKEKIVIIFYRIPVYIREICHTIKVKLKGGKKL